MAPRIVDLRPSLNHSRRRPVAKSGGSSSKRPEPLRLRRRRWRLVLVLAILLGAAIILYGLHWVSYRPALRIQEISVRGAELQDPQAVIRFAQAALESDSFHFIARNNIFAYPKALLQGSIVEAFPRLESVRVGRATPLSTTLIVNVDERPVHALWCQDAAASSSTCYVFDPTGFVFADAASTPTRPEIPYTFSGGIEVSDPIGQVFLEGHLFEMHKLLVGMEDANFPPIRVHIESDGDFEAYVQNGFSIKASLSQEVDVIVRNLELVSASEALRGRVADLEYIDLRFGNRVYYKFKGEEVPPTQEG